MPEHNRRPLLYVGLHATDDPTLATLPFLAGSGAASADIDCAIALMGEAVNLVKPGIIEAVKGVGFSPLAELVEKTRTAGIHVYV